MAAIDSGSSPVVTKLSSSDLFGSMTPSAAYLAPVSSAAVSVSRWRSASSESSEVRAIPASKRLRMRSATSQPYP